MPLPKQFENRNLALVLGAGISGLAAASLLCSRGYEVVVFGACNKDKEKNALLERGVKFSDVEIASGVQEFCTSPELIKNIFAVLSPGISIKSKAIELLKQASIPIIGEMELGLLLGENLLPFIAITGSKGKSSIVKLIADTLTLSGKPSVPCGNYGTATCTIAEKGDRIIPIVECSSFQLESTTDSFAPKSAILLNISPDHLDRHSSIEEYRDTKLRMFEHCLGRKLIPEESDYGIDMAISSIGMDLTKFTQFGKTTASEFSYSDGKIHTNNDNDNDIDISGSYFDNSIIGPGAAAAAAVLLEHGLTVSQIEYGFKHFVPLPHRMQNVGTVNDVLFINDSKATSITALFAGCKMAATARKPIFLIAGGKLKEKITLKANHLVDFCVKKVYIIGECIEEMVSAWGKDIEIEKCYTLDVAINRAFLDAKQDKGIVLLSPGTASFDQFKSYNERGECFTKLVAQL